MAIRLALPRFQQGQFMGQGPEPSVTDSSSDVDTARPAAQT